MKRLIEAALFVPLAVGLHLAAFGLASNGSGGTSGGGAGMGGENEITLTALPRDLVEQVKDWDSAPQPNIDGPTAPQPDQAAPPPTPPTSLSAPTLPPPPTAPGAAAPNPPPQPAAPPVALRAKGTGKTTTAGTSAGNAAAQQQALTASWGAQIQARVARAHRVPAAIRRQRQSGTVLVRMQVAATGDLLAAVVRKSSGNAALDQAALASVRRAGRFPAAPEGLRAAQLSFDIPLEFKLN
ncbi:energy transducer TonB [Actibacterium sp.]|uniref:energy transducer TonB family protein n=1 Tax=Actibacterium sp. TaxID=1872125 RepID=UPI0035624FC3